MNEKNCNREYFFNHLSMEYEHIAHPALPALLHKKGNLEVKKCGLAVGLHT